MYEILGRLALLVPLVWVTGYVWFITVDTFSPGLFSGNIFQKTLGVLMYIAVSAAWLYWLV